MVCSSRVRPRLVDLDAALEVKVIAMSDRVEREVERDSGRLDLEAAFRRQMIVAAGDQLVDPEGHLRKPRRVEVGRAAKIGVALADPLLMLDVSTVSSL